MTTDKLVSDIRSIIEQGRKQAYATVNQTAVLTYWHIGQRIVEEEQHGNARAQYGAQLIKTLAEQLSIEFGANYSERRLRDYRQFYLSFSDLPIWHSECQILPGRTFDASWQYHIQMPDDGMRKSPLARCGVSARSTETSPLNIMDDYVLQKERAMYCLSQKTPIMRTPKNT